VIDVYQHGGPVSLLCPHCPFCGKPPAFILVGSTQAFCGNEDCRLMCWNPSKTAVDNLDAIGTVDFDGEDAST
jgi:hypothetical protein